MAQVASSLLWCSSLVLALTACSKSSSSPASPAPLAPADGGAADGATVEDGGAPGPNAVPLEAVAYPGGQSGVYLRTTVSVDGSPPIGVLVDTGSNGLRIFASALGGTSISSSNEALSVDFGGDLLAGHKASAVVHIGSMATASPISIQLVETFSC